MSTAYSNTEKLEFAAKMGAMIQSTTGREALTDRLSADSGLSVLADTADTVHLVVPADLDAERIAQGDEAYLMEIGRRALGNCMYDILPE
ncbi:hypothetical protein [Roseibium litorale]|uniref:Uncharacterized protein n=1 Tax=Roseibium litorale TaxID=2803841 RepID=A0ABR9CGC0_9HYPH|nr:hypothetical protein [Roseibium litorale]MBD8889952.1 hypothetical protein [Roseibium litorale]